VSLQWFLFHDFAREAAGWGGAFFVATNATEAKLTAKEIVRRHADMLFPYSTVITVKQVPRLDEALASAARDVWTARSTPVLSEPEPQPSAAAAATAPATASASVPEPEPDAEPSAATGTAAAAAAAAASAATAAAIAAAPTIPAAAPTEVLADTVLDTVEPFHADTVIEVDDESAEDHSNTCIWMHAS
jgi:hypothetical protein